MRQASASTCIVFEYGRGEQPVLNDYCSEVSYYGRHEGHKGFSHKLPYIVCSRSNGQLLERLLQDDYPILLEGIHCTYLLNDERFSQRRIILRLHNVEYQYYRQLYHSEKSLWKRCIICMKAICCDNMSAGSRAR